MISILGQFVSIQHKSKRQYLVITYSCEIFIPVSSKPFEKDDYAVVFSSNDTRALILCYLAVFLYMYEEKKIKCSWCDKLFVTKEH